MANAKKCDRCNRLYEFYEGVDFGKVEYKYSWLRLLTTHGSAYKTYDLCPTCMIQVIAFLNNHKELDVNGEPRKRCMTCKFDGESGCMYSGDLCGMNYEHWEAKDE